MRCAGRTSLVLVLVLTAATACAGGSGSTTSPTTATAASTSTQSAATTSPPVASTQKSLAELVATARSRAPDITSSAPALLVHVRAGGQSRTLAFGAATRSPRRAARADDTVMLASLTKTLVATLALQLVRDGKLRLTDPVEKWLPGLLAHGREVTVEQLLSMTSGLPTYDTAPSYPGSGRLPAQQLLALVRNDDLQFSPGTAAQESNTNYVALGLVVERAGGASLASQLTTRIDRVVNVSALRLGGTPTGHGYDGAADVTVVSPRYPSAAAGGVASLPAYVAFFDALLAGRLLGAAQLAEMQRPRQDLEGQGYGLGLRSRDVPCGRAYGQVGGNDGYTVRIWSVPAVQRTVMVAITGGGQEGAADQLLDELLCG